MECYLDISIRPDPDFPTHQILSVLFQKLHRVLVQIASSELGVSFPNQVPRKLGNILRIHGSKEALSKLMSEDWLVGVRDHINIAEIIPIPADVQYRTVHRVQPKSNAERLRRRAIKRHKLSEEEAKKKIPDSAAEVVDLPFVQLFSSSSGQRFPVFIKHGTLKSEAIAGSFSTYGLSDKATIPWF